MAFCSRAFLTPTSTTSSRTFSFKPLPRLVSLREVSKFPGWLASIARNRAIDFHRRAMPTDELTDETACPDSHSHALPVPPTPHSSTEAHAALTAILTLPEAYRETLILRLVEGMTGPEIAARTGLTHGSVRASIFIAGCNNSAKSLPAKPHRSPGVSYDKTSNRSLTIEMPTPNDYLWDGSGTPDPEIQRLESLLGQFRHTDRPLTLPDATSRIPATTRSSGQSWAPRLAAAAIIVLSLVTGVLVSFHPAIQPPTGPGWTVADLEGTPQIGSQPIASDGSAKKLYVGQTLTTNSSSRAALSDRDLGEIQIDRNSRVRLLRVDPDHKRLQLQVGTIHASIWAPPASSLWTHPRLLLLTSAVPTRFTLSPTAPASFARRSAGSGSTSMAEIPSSPRVPCVRRVPKSGQALLISRTLPRRSETPCISGILAMSHPMLVPRSSFSIPFSPRRVRATPLLCGTSSPALPGPIGKKFMPPWLASFLLLPVPLAPASSPSIPTCSIFTGTPWTSATSPSGASSNKTHPAPHPQPKNAPEDSRFSAIPRIAMFRSSDRRFRC